MSRSAIVLVRTSESWLSRKTKGLKTLWENMNLDVKRLPDLSDSQRPRLGKYVIMKEASKITG